MVAPFVTAGETVNHIDVLHVMLEHEGHTGRSETMGVDYFGETVESMQTELSTLDPLAIAQLDRGTIQPLLPPGGARIDKMNVLDACWHLLSILAVAAAAADAHRQLPRMSQNVPT